MSSLPRRFVVRHVLNVHGVRHDNILKPIRGHAGKRSPEPPPRVKHAGFDRVDGAVSDLSDLAVTEAVEGG